MGLVAVDGQSLVAQSSRRIRDLHARSSDYCAKQGSEFCTANSMDGPNPYLAHNIYVIYNINVLSSDLYDVSIQHQCIRVLSECCNGAYHSYW